MSPHVNKDHALDVLNRKRKLAGKALTYSEKILFLHEANSGSQSQLIRGKYPIRLSPDQVAMQDATAQMAMLQFIQAGRNKTRVPATIHCDHLLRAGQEAEQDLAGLKPQQPVQCIIKKKDGSTVTLLLNHTLATEQIKWFKAGSALNTLG